MMENESMTTTQKAIGWAFVAIAVVHLTYVWWGILAQ
jgi:hypothetical protein